MKKFVSGLLVGLILAVAVPTFAANLTATITSYNFRVNGEAKQLSDSPVLIGATTYLPLRATANLLGYDVVYDGASRTISLTGKTVAGSAAVDTTVPSVKLDRSLISLSIGSKATLTATVLPAATEDKSIIWSSSNMEVVTVESGEVTAVSSGTAIVTATSTNDRFASCTVTVDDPYIANARKVRYIADRSVQYDENGKYWTLLFSLQDANETRIKSASYVDISIANKLGVTVYSKKHFVTEADFGTWTSPLLGSRLLCSIRIMDSDIQVGDSKDGTIRFTVYYPGATSFEESVLSISGLPYTSPVTKSSLELPPVPQVTSYRGYSGTLYSSVNVTDIGYEFEEGYDGNVELKLYFSGEKTFDYRGTNQSSPCQIGYKIYDADGYVVEDGTLYSPSVKVGEKFKNAEEVIYRLAPGEYTLKIFDVN